MKISLIYSTGIFIILSAGCFAGGVSANTFYDNFKGSQPFVFAEFNLPVQLYDQYLNKIYQQAGLQEAGLDTGVFRKAMTGYYNLQEAGKTALGNRILTIVDYAKSSCSKRMWIIDLQQRKLLLNTWVAHGQGSGDDMASHFSNALSSFQSSLGFYITGKLYSGKHGRSLRLQGMDEGYNDHAQERDIVLHAATYVSEGTIHELGRLGRSQGCPAVSPSVISQVLGLIYNQSVIFVNGNDSTYSSRYLNEELAASSSLKDSMDLNAESPVPVISM